MNNYCSYCGANLEEIEPEKVKNVRISDITESNKVEIVKDYKLNKYGNICGVLLLLFVLIGLIIVGQSINPFVAFAFVVLFIFSIPIWLSVLFKFFEGRLVMVKHVNFLFQIKKLKLRFQKDLHYKLIVRNLILFK